MMNWSGGFDFDELESIPACIVSRLNEVKLNAFDGYPGQLRLADFFLKLVVGLKKNDRSYKGRNWRVQLRESVEESVRNW